MLTDRKALLEHDIRELQEECGRLYKSIVLGKQNDLNGLYQTKLNKLADLKSELNNIDFLLAKGTLL